MAKLISTQFIHLVCKLTSVLGAPRSAEIWQTQGTPSQMHIAPFCLKARKAM